MTDSEIEGIWINIGENMDGSWTKQCIATVREIIKPLQARLDTAVEDRNKAGMTERRKYLPLLQDMDKIIKEAIRECEADHVRERQSVKTILEGYNNRHDQHNRSNCEQAGQHAIQGLPKP